MVIFVCSLDRLRRWLYPRIGEVPSCRWSPAARRMLRIELVWFVQLHLQLAKDGWG